MKFGELHRRPGDFLCVCEAPITIQRVGIIFSYNDIANSVPLATAVQLPPSFLVVLVPFGTPYLIHARIIYARVDTIFCLSRVVYMSMETNRSGHYIQMTLHYLILIV